MEFRTGLGWDVHRTGRNLPFILGGIAIEADFGLEGHSDADVLAHAVCDAVLGPSCARYQLNLAHVLDRGPGATQVADRRSTKGGSRVSTISSLT